MILEKMFIKGFSERHKGFRIVYEIDSIHPSLNSTIKVGYQPAGYDKGKTSWFWAFFNDEYLPNPLSFPSVIQCNDVSEIAKAIAEHVFERCQLKEIIDESNGVVPCDEKKGIQKTCDDCPDYRPNKGECFGPMWNYPSTVNLLEIEKQWNPKYGPGSIAEQEYLHSQLISEVNQYMHRCGGNGKMIIELLEYISTHPSFTPQIDEARLSEALTLIANKNNKVVNEVK